MAGIIISESSGRNDPLFGKWQAPIASFLETRAEAIDQGSVARKIFREVNSTHYAESYGGMTAMDDFEPSPENGEYPHTDFEVGYMKVIQNVTWKQSFAISKEIIDDGNMIEMKRRPQAFMKAYERTKERFFARLLGTALQGKASFALKKQTFDTTGADGVCIFSNAHKGKISGETLVNAYKDEFSASILGKAATAMQNMHDDNGNTLGLTPDTIVIPNIEGIKAAVWAAIGSEKIPGSSNNDYNYQFGNWNVIIWPYLNDFIGTLTAPWILMDSKYMEECDVAIMQEREKLTVTSHIASNDANEWKGRTRYTGGFVDFRGMLAGGLAAGGTL